LQSTATDRCCFGYRAYLARFPKQHLSVAVLCNVSAGEADRYAHTVAALYLGNALVAPRPDAAGAPDGGDVPRPAALASRAGLYRNTVTGNPLGIVHKDGQLSLEGAPGNVLVAGSDSRFDSPESGRRYDFDSRGGLRVSNPNGTVDVFERVERASPTADDLAGCAGTYSSDEAEAVLEVASNGNTLVMKRRPDTILALRPIYSDAFYAPGLGLVRFRRDAAGKVVALSVTVDRVWDLRFNRQ
jgi:hypothetical protein